MISSTRHRVNLLVRITVLVAVPGLMYSCGAAKELLETPGVCFAEIETSLTDKEVRSFWPEDWFGLVLKDFDRYSKIPDKKPKICTGKKLYWPRPRECRVHESRPVALPREAVSDKELFFSQVSEKDRLVWAISRRYEGGEALGTVALTRFTRKGVLVKAIGMLRAPGQNVTMEIKPTDDCEVLLVEGELCEDNTEKACPRFVRALLKRGSRFKSVSLTNKLGDCQGPAYFPLARSATKTISSTVERSYVLTSRVTVSKKGIVVHEQLIVNDTDSTLPDAAPRLRRKAEIDRLVRVVDGRLIPESQSLWHLVEVEQGIVPEMSVDRVVIPPIDN